MVIWGTLFEAAYGLLAAREKFFHSWIFWTYNIPFPGIKLISLILLWNLVFRSVEFLKSPLKNSGLILIHLGVAFLLSGALFTAKFSKEYFLPLHEGEASGSAYSYESSEIAVLKKSVQFPDAFIYDSVPISGLKNGQTVNFSRTGISFTIENIHVKKVAEKGVERKTVTHELTLLLGNSCNSQSGNKIVLTSGSQPQPFFCDRDTVYFVIRPVSVPIPVHLKLLDFSNELHPGTETLKNVQSHVSVKNGSAERDVNISMNKPLRIGAYTFYQASYSQVDGNEISNFSVVYNPFRFFPYAASLIIVGGLLLHMILLIVFRKIKEIKAGN